VSGCVLAYGQTGAGKTYTLLELESYACPRRQSTLQPECRPSAGRYAKLGIIPRLVQAIFDRAEKEASTHDVTIRCSYLQIYMEHVQVFRSPPPHPHPGTHAHAYMHMRVHVHARTTSSTNARQRRSSSCAHGRSGGMRHALRER
jgi:hypothetical protein